MVNLTKLIVGAYCTQLSIMRLVLPEGGDGCRMELDRWLPEKGSRSQVFG